MTKEVYLYYLLILNVIVPNSNIVDFVDSVSHAGNSVEGDANTICILRFVSI